MTPFTNSFAYFLINMSAVTKQLTSIFKLLETHLQKNLTNVFHKNDKQLNKQVKKHFYVLDIST